MEQFDKYDLIYIKEFDKYEKSLKEKHLQMNKIW